MTPAEQSQRQHAATVAAPLDASPEFVAPTPVVPALKLVVRGFSDMERTLLEGTVRLSQRRTPRLQLLADTEVDGADVVMVDASDVQAVAWAKGQPSLGCKAVIWVDSATAARGHTVVRRPVQWSILPMLLARALEQGPSTRHSPPTAPEKASVAAPGAATAAARPLLVVDDSLAVRAYMRSQLESRGHQVVDVDNAQAAIDAVAETAFACVLMDVLMPGIDGYEGCKRIKARLRGAASVPVIMLTSKSSPFDRIRGKMAGCDAYLTKSAEPDRLHEVLAQYVHAPVRPAAVPALAYPTVRLSRPIAT